MPINKAYYEVIPPYNTDNTPRLELKKRAKNENYKFESPYGIKLF